MADFEANMDKIAETLRGSTSPGIKGLAKRLDVPYSERQSPEPPRGNGGPPDISRVAELSARGIDKIATETADQIREVGEAAVTHAEALRAEANVLADSIVEQGRKFSDRVTKFTNTAEAMMQSLNDQRARFSRDN